jgi:hypothetical protein
VVDWEVLALAIKGAAGAWTIVFCFLGMWELATLAAFVAAPDTKIGW